jgi:Tol biopolymer transport system component
MSVSSVVPKAAPLTHESRLRRVLAATGLVVLIAVAAALPASAASFMSVVRTSLDIKGTAQKNQPSHSAAVSADGLVSVFISDGAQAGKTNQVQWRSLVTTDGARVSEPQDQTIPSRNNGDCTQPSVSGTGGVVAFSSVATNLVTPDTNGAVADVFVKTIEDGAIEMADVNDAGDQANAAATQATISSDGHHVVFVSSATNLTTISVNGSPQVYIRNLLTRTTRLVSVSNTGVAANGTCRMPRLSADGRYVVFETDATNLMNNDTNGVSDIFIRDTAGTGQTQRVSRGDGTQGVQADGASRKPTISDDGRYVVFESDATNLVTGDTNGVADIFVRDRTAGTTRRVSVTLAGAEANAACSNGFISGDGAFVAFQSAASNLASPAVTAQNVFVRNLTSGSIGIATIGIDGSTDTSGAVLGGFSRDGTKVTFSSAWSKYLHPTDTLPHGDSNGVEDVFVTTMSLTDIVRPITSSDAQEYYTGPATITLTPTNPGGLGVGATYYTVDGVGPQLGTSIAVPGVPATHTITFWSVDIADNEEIPHKTATFFVDMVAPVTTSNARSYYDGPATITLTSTDVGGSGVRLTYYSIDDLPDATGTSVSVPTALGWHHVDFWARDVAGNLEAFHTATFKVILPDGTAPHTDSDRAPYYATSATIHLTANDGLGGSGVAHTYYILDNTSQAESSTVRVSGAGVHTLKFWSVDVADNVEPTQTVTFTVITAPSSNGTPSTPQASSTSIRHGRTYTFSGYVVRHTSGTYPVSLQFYRYQSGHWVLRKTTTGRVTTILTFSRYYRSTSVPYSGRWRVRAGHKVGSHYHYSGYLTFTAS